MAKSFLLFILLLTGAFSYAQLYKKPVYPQQYFRWPTQLTPDIVANMGELRPNHWHMGLDVRTNQKVNQQVVAAADGYIAFVGIEPLSWGRWIIINHPNGLSTLYGHLNDFRPDLEAYVRNYQYQEESWETHLDIPPGKFPVKKGDFISYSGTTGGSQGPHVHWEVIDTKSGRRLNPDLFGTPFNDEYPPTLVKLVMYDRNNSTYDQYPGSFSLHKSGSSYTVPGSILRTSLNNLSFAIQAYDTWNRAGNRDGIYSARLFVDDEEISSFYIDSIGYNSTRYMNCQVDYKMKANGGAWVQHISKLPGDRGGVYYDLGWNKNTIRLTDTAQHEVRILVSDTRGNTSTLLFKLQNNGAAPPSIKSYEWLPNRLNRIFKYDFEAYLPMFVLYDKMNPGYARLASSGGNSVSARHTLGEKDIPAHSDFEVRIKPEKVIAAEHRNRIVIKRTAAGSSVKKASWNGEWLTALFRDFGTFEAFVDNIPPSINSLGSGEVVDLSRASRIAFTPTDNFGIADFRAEIDGQWIRFTNDKGKTYLYYFDEKVPPGEHTLTVTVTDIAGNRTERSWKFRRGGGAVADKPANPRTTVKKTGSAKHTVTKKTGTSRAKTTGKASSGKTAKKTTSGSKKKK